MKLIWAIMFLLTTSASISISMSMSMSIGPVSSSPQSPSRAIEFQCNPPTNTFLHHLNLICPLSISSSLPIEMNGEALERVLSSTSMTVYTAVLFYDSGSPFSSGIRSKFNMLSSMYPQISHIAVEQSLVMPSLFSKYGVHSLPALFIVKQAVVMRYYGPKDFHSLAKFYKRTTGFDPVEYHDDDVSDDIINGQLVLQPWYQSSWREVIVKEPYLVFAFLFVVLRAFLYLFPGILSHVAALWILCKRQFNLGIVGESSQLLGRILHLIDVKRIWSKLKLCKSRNFQKGARSARVWASSLASVSLGETSARPSSSVES